MSQIFVSHASEDKAGFVRPLAHALKEHGLKVWYDEFSLRPGDSLRRSIDRGLANCAAGVVVLSPAFFEKEWPQRELDALYTAEIGGRSKIIPVWYQVRFAEVAAVSPLLADRVAIKAELGVDTVASKIAEQFPIPGKYAGSELAEILLGCRRLGLFPGEAFYAGCQYRFLTLNAFKEEYCQIADKAFLQLSDQELDDFPPALEKRLREEENRLRKKYRLSEDIYLTTDEPVRKRHLASYRDAIGHWSSGTLTRVESERLVRDLDLEELDEYYVLLDVPNFAISRHQRPLLERALVELGCGFEDGYSKVDELCAELQALDTKGA